jgi:hypothetical protein
MNKGFYTILHKRYHNAKNFSKFSTVYVLKVESITENSIQGCVQIMGYGEDNIIDILCTQTVVLNAGV